MVPRKKTRAGFRRREFFVFGALVRAEGASACLGDWSFCHVFRDEVKKSGGQFNDLLVCEAFALEVSVEALRHDLIAALVEKFRGGIHLFTKH